MAVFLLNEQGIFQSKPIQDGQYDVLEFGVWTALFERESGFLREIKWRQQPVLRGVYGAVRDENWNTVSPVLEHFNQSEADDQVEFSFRYACVNESIDYVWEGNLVLHRNDWFRYEFEGRARRSFLRNRIGFCVLHHASLAGHPCRIVDVKGAELESQFPESIAPYQPFKNLREIAHRLPTGEWARLRLEGETFEMEDQRNWTDASFKTYCTPLDQPFPVSVEKGEQVKQSVFMEVRSSGGETDSMEFGAQRICISPDWERCAERIPIGVAHSPQGAKMTASEQSFFERLGLNYLRCELREGEEGYLNHLEESIALTQRTDASLHLALTFKDRQNEWVRTVLDQLDRNEVQVPVIYVFDQAAKVTSETTLEWLRHQLGDRGTLVYGGTDAFFAELNRNRPEGSSADGVVFSINPQVHAFDDLSLMETVAVHDTVVESARGFWSGYLAVAPITLKMRWNPNATSIDSRLPAEREREQFDPRLWTRFGAAWTVASLAAFHRVGPIEGLTYFQSHGPLGMVTERACGTSGSLWVSPLWDFFRLWSSVQGCCSLEIASSACACVGLGVRFADQSRGILLANVSHRDLEFELGEGVESEAWSVWNSLSEPQLVSDVADVETGWRTLDESVRGTGGFKLAPFDWIALRAG